METILKLEGVLTITIFNEEEGLNHKLNTIVFRNSFLVIFVLSTWIKTFFSDDFRDENCRKHGKHA